MNVGDTAQLERAFSEQEIAAYHALCGPTGLETVPEPLIGALWSCLLGVHLPGAGTMYLKQETEFCDQATIGETLTASVEITRIRPEKQLADLKTNCRNAQGRIIARGRALVYIGFVRKHPG